MASSALSGWTSASLTPSLNPNPAAVNLQSGWGGNPVGTPVGPITLPSGPTGYTATGQNAAGYGNVLTGGAGSGLSAANYAGAGYPNAQVFQPGGPGSVNTPQGVMSPQSAMVTNMGGSLTSVGSPATSNVSPPMNTNQGGSLTSAGLPVSQVFSPVNNSATVSPVNTALLNQIMGSNINTASPVSGNQLPTPPLPFPQSGLPDRNSIQGTNILTPDQAYAEYLQAKSSALAQPGILTNMYLNNLGKLPSQSQSFNTFGGINGNLTAYQRQLQQQNMFLQQMLGGASGPSITAQGAGLGPTQAPAATPPWGYAQGYGQAPINNVNSSVLQTIYGGNYGGTSNQTSGFIPQSTNLGFGPMSMGF